MIPSRRPRGRRRILITLLAGLTTGGQFSLGSTLVAADASRGPEQLSIGDPARRDRRVTPVLGAIVDTTRNETIDATELARRLAETRVLFIGEEHTNGEFHRVQQQTIEALHAAGRRVIIGLEMFPWTPQPALERWSAGLLTEEAFLDESRWYEVWSHHWGLYRDIFNFARQKRLRLVGINAPREIVRTVRSTRGFEGLAAEARAQLPAVIDRENLEHRRLVNSYFDAEDPLHAKMSPEAQEGVYLAQLTWDAAMGWQAGRALSVPEDPREIVVVLIGAGHVAYDLGAARHVPPTIAGRVASLIPVTLDPALGIGSKQVSAAYANYIWGVPRTPQPTLPVFGVSLMGRLGKEPTQVIQLEARSPAATAGVQLGDILRRLDGVPITSAAVLQRRVGTYQWGDSAMLELERAGESVRLRVDFRRSPP